MVKKTKKAFTLVELVVVIAVIAVLAAVSVGAYFGITKTASISNDEQTISILNTHFIYSNVERINYEL